MKNVLFVLATLVAIGCGGDGGGGVTPGEPLSQARAEEVCADGCEFTMMCDPANADPNCVTECVQHATTWLNGAAAIELFECVQAGGCGTDPETCFASIDGTATHDAYVAECKTKMGTCGVTEPQLTEACTGNGGLVLFADVVIQEMDACLDMDCQMITTCWQSVFQNNGIGG